MFIFEKQIIIRFYELQHAQNAIMYQYNSAFEYLGNISHYDEYLKIV